MRSFCYLLASIYLLLSCNRPVSREELLSYLNDPAHGLKQEVQSGPYTLRLTYRPAALLQEQEGSQGASEARTVEYDQYHYFLLSMSQGDGDVLYKGSANQQQFSASLNRLNFGLPEYIYARTDQQDTLYLADYYVPNLYGMGGSTQILLAFPKKAAKEYKELEITIKELGFGTGNQRFGFRQKDIEKIPALKAGE